MTLVFYTMKVKPFLKDHPTGHKDVVSQNMWCLVTGSITLKYQTLETGRWFLKTGFTVQLTALTRNDSHYTYSLERRYINFLE